ncbi:hypothetical protein DQ04_10561010 [Trypanosoma grayi]|uniref:hypothetical protein n=1 Tax=Trypanosoma grayi TaxID=71804 RepID=UPI0004F41118|nr:hypothetical protein DQ04_10561010 [Trypanosoma grayi]KEG07207.1 hypothetical protein DQ04_10561010 [Trypanosoma grayi]
MAVALRQLRENASLDVVVKPDSLTRQSDSIRSISRIRSETVQKRSEIQRLTVLLRRDEDKVRLRQARLDRLLKEKANWEKEVDAVVPLLPGSKDVSELKTRLITARECGLKAANKVNDADAFLTLAAEALQGRDRGEAKQRRDYLEMKQSINSLSREILRLRKHLGRLNKNVKDVDVKSRSPSLPNTVGSFSIRLESPSEVEKLKDEKKRLKEQMREANEAYLKAAQREAQVVTLLTSLERRAMKTTPLLRSSLGPKQGNEIANDAGEKNDVSFASPPEAGHLLAVSVSHPMAAGIEASVHPRKSGENSSFHDSVGRTNRQRRAVSFIPKDGVGSGDYSEREMLALEVERLAAQYAHLKRRVGKMRKSLA